MKKESKDTERSNALVVGAGISGIRTALDLAQQGYKVCLIDSHPATGGLLNRLDYQFPTNHCGMCRMLPLVERDQGSQYCMRKGVFHENIDLALSCELRELTGEPGNFTARLKEKPTWVDPSRCVGCGLCESVCPEEIVDCFNEGLSRRKAIHLPIPHAIPNSYVVDLAFCSRCGACESVCPTDAIQLSDVNRKAFSILVVDDELSIRDSLKEWLEEDGFSVDMADSGQAALAALEEKNYRLMITDIKMPEMDGVQLLEKARQSRPDLCVVMMTAYATVETAIDAMKTGARDYLIKPFNPESLIPMVVRIFQDMEASKDRQIQVDTVVFALGTSFYHPADERNVFGYGIYPNVLTHIEFERMLSPTGPSPGTLRRLDNGLPVKRIAWLQCVGSRDVQANADYCSGICCMIAAKEAVLARRMSGGNVAATIFYMDMRSWGKSFQSYVDQAARSEGVRFVRCKVHSLSLEQKTHDLALRYLSEAGHAMDETFDMVVLSTGMRPGPDMARLAQTCGLDLNPWGFLRTPPFNPAGTSRDGIFASGSTTGLRDISESLILASAASANAAGLIKTRRTDPETRPEPVESEPQNRFRDVSREAVKILAVLCTCSDRLEPDTAAKAIKKNLTQNPAVGQVAFVERLCTAQGWQQFTELLRNTDCNRVLLGACHPYVFTKKIRLLGQSPGFDPGLVHAVDVMTPLVTSPDNADLTAMTSLLNQGAAFLNRSAPVARKALPAIPKVLVIGAGIAGMTAALTLAGQGIETDLVEKQDTPGGNLNWLTSTVEGHDPGMLLSDTLARLEKRPGITLYSGARLLDVTGSAGRFKSTFEDSQGQAVTMEYGAVILATGGQEAATKAYGYGSHDGIITQKQLETRLDQDDHFTPDTVVMILCVDSRVPGANYCSRVCCPTAIKQARTLKKRNPDSRVFVLYRDMMTCGFTEAYFTKARKEQILFMAYEPDNVPRVETGENGLCVLTRDPVLDQDIEIPADLLVLATGIAPELTPDLAEKLGVSRDENGFFQEADPKWRPLDNLEQGIFACGIVQAPRSVAQSVATAQAAAQRAATLVSRPEILPDRGIATIRHALCSRCQACIPACPYGARSMDTQEDRITINELACQGCGACVSACPNGASLLEGYSSSQVLDMIDTVFNTLPN